MCAPSRGSLQPVTGQCDFSHHDKARRGNQLLTFKNTRPNVRSWRISEGSPTLGDSGDQLIADLVSHQIGAEELAEMRLAAAERQAAYSAARRLDLVAAN